MNASHRTIHAEAGASLRHPTSRSRARIIGSTRGENSFFADWDACWLDEQSIVTEAQWRAIILAKRWPEVRGAFVLAWKDGDSWHLIRDGVGERTLFYAPIKATGDWIFASSIRDLLSTNQIDRSLNLASVARYLAYAYLPGRETLIEGVSELLAGEQVTLDCRSHSSRTFWELPAEQTIPLEQSILEQRLRKQLEIAVQRRLPAPGESLGASLSGGLDSSLVVALARQLHIGPLKTYSVSFGSGYANELPFSSMLADHCGTEHRIVEMSPEVVLHHLDDSIALLNEPIGDPLTVPNALLFRAASAEVNVVLNGEGGDPCFGGPKNLPMLLAALYCGPTREESYLRAHLKCYDDFMAMLKPHGIEALRETRLEGQLTRFFNDPRWHGFVTKLQAINILFKGPHHILPKVDALSAIFGVYARAPLFDRDLVELSMDIPPHLKLKGSTEKYLLKQTVRDLLPREIIDRPKSGMLVPVEGWFQGPLLKSARERLLDGLTRFDLFERIYLERLLAGKLGGLRPRHGVKIWMLITLESWLRQIDIGSG